MAALRRNPMLEWMYELGTQAVTRSSLITSGIPSALSKQLLTQSQAQTIFEQWDELVRERALYTEEGGCSLKQAACLISLSSRQLSEAINRIYNASYSQYMNDLRVAYAKTLMQQQPDLALSRILYDAGFNTKSSFNREFRRCEGLTPVSFACAVPGLINEIRGTSATQKVKSFDGDIPCVRIPLPCVRIVVAFLKTLH